jgi:hypothetical protein
VVEPAATTHQTTVVVLVVVAGAAALAFALALLVGQNAPGPAAAAPVPPTHPVAGDFEPTRVKIEDCSDQACLEQAYGSLAYYSGPKHALAVLEKEVGSTTNACHRIAHIIGAASLVRFERNVGRTFAEGSAVCASGYYHGVLERSLVNVADRSASVLGGVARGLCDDPSVKALTELEYQCLHGLGHGLMITTGYNLPLALQVCDHLADEWESSSCNGGVFMENISTSYGFRSTWLKDDDLVYPCDWVAKEDKLTCYQLVTSRIIGAIGPDWERVAEICAGVERGWVSSCFESYGRDVAGQAHRDPGEILELCAVARPDGGEDECITFAAYDLVGNDASGEQAASLCSGLDDALRETCFHAIGLIRARATPTRADALAGCRVLADGPDAAACARGADAHFAGAGSR